LASRGPGLNDRGASRIEALLAHGAPWEAIDAFRSASDPASGGPPDATVLYWGALAHARAGDTREAHVLLDSARDASPTDELLQEILCLEGRLAKDEDERKPFTDDQLAAELQKQGIQVTRRTVARRSESAAAVTVQLLSTTTCATLEPGARAKPRFIRSCSMEAPSACVARQPKFSTKYPDTGVL